MMRGLLFFLFLFGLNLKAQTPSELLKRYKDVSFPDSVRLHAIDDLGWMYVNSKPDSAIFLSEEEIKLVEQLKGPERWKALAFGTQGSAFMVLGNYPKALSAYLNALKVNEQIGDKRGIASSNNNIGLVYQEQKNYSKAMEYYQKCLEISMATKDRKTE